MNPKKSTMQLTLPPIQELVAPASWRAVEFISDLHLDASEPATVAALAHYLATSKADAIFLLGDLFEVWVGDDSMDEAGSFEAQCCALLAQAATQRPLFFMHGNRDFLVGSHFEARTGVQLLNDPTVLVFSGERWLLSHGDALCLDDVDYQKFRAVASNPAWQAHLLSLPLAARRAQHGVGGGQPDAQQRVLLQPGIAPARHSMSSRCCSAREAPMAVSTFFTSSGGGSTAGMPSDLIHSSRHQPVVW